MKALFELILKTINESDKSEIFWCSGRSNPYLTSNPSRGLSDNDRYYMNHASVSETDHTFQFTLKFDDGDPDVYLDLQTFKSTETKTEEVNTGPFWNKKVTGGKIIVVKSHPIYSITAGELKYTTTVEEAKELHKAYVNLINRDKNSKMSKQEKQIKERLEGKIKLNTKRNDT